MDWEHHKTTILLYLSCSVFSIHVDKNSFVFKFDRYVEIFKSTLAEARSAIAAAHRAAQSTGFNTRSSPYDRRDAMMGRGGYGHGGAGRGNVKGIMGK